MMAHRLATTVTRSQPTRLPRVGLHENYGIRTQGEHDRKLFQRILSTARSINNAAVLHKVTSSLVTRVRNIQANGGHFEHLARVLNGESVTLHLKPYLSECPWLFFPI